MQIVLIHMILYSMKKTPEYTQNYAMFHVLPTYNQTIIQASDGLI